MQIYPIAWPLYQFSSYFDLLKTFWSLENFNRLYFVCLKMLRVLRSIKLHFTPETRVKTNALSKICTNATLSYKWNPLLRIRYYLLRDC